MTQKEFESLKVGSIVRYIGEYGITIEIVTSVKHQEIETKIIKCVEGKYSKGDEGRILSTTFDWFEVIA